MSKIRIIILHRGNTRFVMKLASNYFTQEIYLSLIMLEAIHINYKNICNICIYNYPKKLFSNVYNQNHLIRLRHMQEFKFI